MKDSKKQQKGNLIRERDSVRERYEIITNYHIFDKRLTMAHKGFLTFLYSLPNSWKITTKATSEFMRINEKTFIKYINELEEIGYIERKKIGKNKITYIIKYRSDKAPFDIKNISNYTIEQLNKFLNDARIEERYKALIKKMIKQALETSEHFNKTLNEIEQETENKKPSPDDLPF